MNLPAPKAAPRLDMLHLHVGLGPTGRVPQSAGREDGGSGRAAQGRAPQQSGGPGGPAVGLRPGRARATPGLADGMFGGVVRKVVAKAAPLRFLRPPTPRFGPRSGTRLGSRLEARRRRVGIRASVADYSPVNLDLYCLAYDGALLGMLAGRAPLSTNGPDYAAIAAVAGAWAEAYDEAWDSAAAIDEVQALAALEGSYAAWEGRTATSLSLAEATPVIDALITATNEAEAYLASVGVSPPPWRETGGASSQSKYRAGGVVDLTGSLQSLVGGGQIIVLTTTAPNFSVIASVNVQDDAELAETVTVALFQNGSQVLAQTLNYDGTGGAITLLYGGDVPAGGDQTFDLRASGGSGGATAQGSLILMATP